MSAYEKILNDPNLYPEKAINNFGAVIKGWETMSPKAREIKMRHIMTCLLICNMESSTISDIVRDLTIKKRMRKEDSMSPSHKRPKKSQETQSLSGSTSTSSSSGKEKEKESSTERGSGVSGEMDTEESEEEEIIYSYRFHLLNYLPITERLTKMYCERWSITTETLNWDIVDRKYKKLVKIEICSNSGSKIREIVSSPGYIQGKCKYIVFDSTKKNFVHNYSKNPPVGLKKALTFLLKRLELCNINKIVETDIQEEPDLIKAIFVSEAMNNEVEEWIQTWDSCTNERWTEEELYSDLDKVPHTITAEELTRGLSTLDESERKEQAKWRGKIMPEGFVNDIYSKSKEDKEMVNEFIMIMEEELSNVQRVEVHTNPKSVLEKSLIFQIMETWREGKRETFDLLSQAEKNNKDNILLSLGTERKQKTHSGLQDNMKQEEHEEIRPMKYPDWFDEVMRRMAQDSSHLPAKPFRQLIEKNEESGNPISKIVEEATTGVVDDLLDTKAAVFSSRLTNLYSRLGGAYHKRRVSLDSDRDKVAIFPLVANISTSFVLDEETESDRIISGIVLRGRQHAKNPTDRISILTIERLIRDSMSLEICVKGTKGITYVTKRSIYLIRQNSIMKEDTSYLTFNINSIFSPINLLGVMTIENPEIPSNCDLVPLINDLLDNSSMWFRDRFAEGVVMSAIGNSRDEGYFACLRKIFMIVLSWRNGDNSACWDISSFCEKTNECLTDNPFSMFFHRSLLGVLKKYGKEEDRCKID